MRIMFIAATLFAVVGGVVQRSAKGQTLVDYWSMNESSGNLNDPVGGATMVPQNTSTFTYGQPGVPAGTYGNLVVTPSESAAFGTSINSNGTSASTAPGIFMTSSTSTPLSSLSPTPGFTVMAWINPTSTGNGNERVLGAFSGGSPQGWWGYGTNAGDYQVLTTYGRADVGANSGSGPNGVGWEHIAATYYDGTVSFYLNGFPAGSGSTSNFTQNYATAWALYGQANDGSNIDWANDLFVGNITQVQVYSGVLTQDQIDAAAVNVPVSTPEPATASILTFAAMFFAARRHRKVQN